MAQKTLDRLTFTCAALAGLDDARQVPEVLILKRIVCGRVDSILCHFHTFKAQGAAIMKENCGLGAVRRPLERLVELVGDLAGQVL